MNLQGNLIKELLVSDKYKYNMGKGPPPTSADGETPAPPVPKAQPKTIKCVRKVNILEEIIQSFSVYKIFPVIKLSLDPKKNLIY